MSFSSEVKEELSAHVDQARHCKIALIAALFHLSPLLENSRVGIRTETGAAAAAFETALRKVCQSEVKKEQSGSRICIYVEGHRQVRRFLEMVKLDRTVGLTNPAHSETASSPKNYPAAGKDFGEALSPEETVRRAQIPAILLQKNCCRKACLRGMFLAAGSVNDPAKSYHLEIVPGNDEDARFIMELFDSIGFGARVTRRKGRSVVYLKDGEQISDFLGVTGATGNLMKLENARILRDIAGNINRQVNFEAANLKKTGIASRRQLEDIALIERTVGIHTLPQALQMAARLRADHPDGSLQEMAEASDPPVGKSGINHRLQRLSEIAQRIREQSEG